MTNGIGVLEKMRKNRKKSEIQLIKMALTRS